MLLLHILKKLMNTIMIKGGPQICGSTQFWNNLGVPFYGHTRAWWPDYLLLILYQGVFQPSHCRL
jgi:hypothetical protein